METLYGESPRFEIADEYNQNGGIAIMSTNTDDKYTGGSIYDEEGHYFEGYQILWSIERQGEEGSYTYTGGVTGKSWYFDDPNSPFFFFDINGTGEETIFNEAKNSGNLNKYFGEWLTDPDISRYQFLGTATEVCVRM